MDEYDLFRTAEEHGLKWPQQRWSTLYDAEAMTQGIEVEQEHTENPRIAAVIAAHHLDEDPDYYTKLLEAGL